MSDCGSEEVSRTPTPPQCNALSLSYYVTFYWQLCGRWLTAVNHREIEWKKLGKPNKRSLAIPVQHTTAWVGLLNISPLPLARLRTVRQSESPYLFRPVRATFMLRLDHILWLLLSSSNTNEFVHQWMWWILKLPTWAECRRSRNGVRDGFWLVNSETFSPSCKVSTLFKIHESLHSGNGIHYDTFRQGRNWCIK